MSHRRNQHRNRATSQPPKGTGAGTVDSGMSRLTDLPAPRWLALRIHVAANIGGGPNTAPT